MLRLGRLTLVLTPDDEYRPAGGFQEGAEAFNQACDLAHTQNQHLPGNLTELSRELMGDFAEAKLRPHLQTMDRLRFRSRIQEGAHPVWTLGGGCHVRHDPDIHRFG